MTSSTFPSDESFFVKAASKLRPQCASLDLRNGLIEHAVRKDGVFRNAVDRNLLFPPSIIQNVLSKDKMNNVLNCRCKICCAVKGRDQGRDQGRDLLISNILKDDRQRRLSAVLVFMGAGFAARYIFSLSTRGFGFNICEDSIKSKLFEPLSSADVAETFSNPEQVTKNFLHTLKIFYRLFDSPKMTLESNHTDLSGENLPFIDEKELNSDNPQNSKLFTFKIHREFKDTNIPVGTSPVFLFHMNPHRPLGNAGSEASRLSEGS